jgi:hypothetical protein
MIPFTGDNTTAGIFTAILQLKKLCESVSAIVIRDNSFSRFSILSAVRQNLGRSTAPLSVPTEFGTSKESTMISKAMTMIQMRDYLLRSPQFLEERDGSPGI